MTTAGPVPADTTMSVGRANLLALLWLPLSAALVTLPFLLLWGSARFTTSPPRLPTCCR